jgi:hypothetical protein
MKFRTMTPAGSTGNEYEASDSEQAAQMAESDGYDVLDVMDDILVIAD